MTRTAGAIALVLLITACGDNAAPAGSADAARPEPDAAPSYTCDEATLDASLASLPQVTAVRETDCGDYVVPPARCFAIDMDQPVDHATPDGATFAQHLFLVHRGCERPTIVADWGYSNTAFFDVELTMLYETNALWVEHRFQGASLPDTTDWDWSALTIENGARDLHQVIAGFRALYPARWVSTGASKGGITAVYHAYFFPDDLDGSIPYVAPASRARVDAAYQDFLDAELPEDCGERVRGVQVAALTTRREMMVDHLTEITGAGGEEEALEYLTASLDWGFWQAWGDAHCDEVPGEDATDDSVWAFYQDFTSLAFAAPAVPDQFMSYGALYYEWLTEQGFALQINSEVAPLLERPSATATMEERFLAMLPDVTLPPYDGAVTAAVRDWVRDEAEDMLLVYGQYDPWSGGMLDAPTRPSSARFVVPAATHAAQIGDLPDEERAAALSVATRLLGVQPVMARRTAAARAGAEHQRRLARLELRTVLGAGRRAPAPARP